MPFRIAVLGLGAMGLPMAAHLAKTFEVIGFDPSDERRALAASRGIAIADSALAASAEADFLLVAVRNAAQLEDLLYGEQGVIRILPEGAAVILTSTVGTGAVEALAARLAKSGIGLVDAPISGPSEPGRANSSSPRRPPPSVWERAEAILHAMAGTLVRIGDEPGKGQAMKTVNQLLCGAHIAAAAEALALAGRLGLDQRTALDALMAGAAECFMLGNRGPRAIEADEGRDPEVLSRLDIFVKDMGIVTEAAKRAGIAIPVAAAEQLFILGNAQGRGAEDDSTVIRVLNPRS